VSEPDASDLDRDPEPPGEVSEAEEVLDAVPVLAGPPRIVPVHDGDPLALEPRGPAVMPAVHAAAVAAGGFMAGAAVVSLVHRRRRRSGALVKGARGRRGLTRGGGSRRDGRAGDLLQIVGSRSLLLDVHLLGGSGDDR
jgi:hypothetical protein